MLPLPASPSVFLKWISTFCSLVTCQLLEPSTVWMSDFWTLDQTCVTQVRYGPRGGWWGVLNHSRISCVGRCVILYILKKNKKWINIRYEAINQKSQHTIFLCESKSTDMSLLLCMVLISAYWQFFKSFPHYLKTCSATRELSHSQWQTLVHSGVYRNDMSATRPVHIRNIFFPVNTHFWFSCVKFLTCFVFTVIWHQNKPLCWVSYRPFKMISRIENHIFNLTLFGTKHVITKLKTD